MTPDTRSFASDNGAWVSAQNADWENTGGTLLRAPRSFAAQAVLSSSPLDADGRYLIDLDPYFWHEWGGGTWNQAWPVNRDSDLPSPNAYELFRDYWVYHDLDHTDGVYFDSINARGGVGAWENFRPEHLAVVDSPLTFSWSSGAAVQVAPQSYSEFLAPIADELHGLGKLIMLNLFHEASRFHAHHADTMGSEVAELVESDVRSRVRRTLAAQKIVSNLLQWNWWNWPDYATYEQMEEFIRGQLFWGFFPAVSSAGGFPVDAAPDRYFLHPELYERDRPLFQRYVPVIRELSAAGWEPVTHATAAPAVQIERFGDFSRGTVLLAVRGADGAAVDAEITLNLEGCGLDADAAPASLTELLAAQPLSFEYTSNPRLAHFNVLLAPGEVGVYEFLPGPRPPADLDGDGDVDFDDLNFLLASYGADAGGDLDDDGDTDFDDLNILLAGYGQ